MRLLFLSAAVHRTESSEAVNMNLTGKRMYCAMILVLGLIVLFAGPGLAAKRTGPVVVPENGYATGATYGTGWECSFGFVNRQGTCDPVVVPAYGYLNSRGDGWKCQRGYLKDGQNCRAIEVPANGYLTASSNPGWACERGYIANRDKCTLIDVPANAYLRNTSFGDPWECERGYRKSNQSCQKIIVPDNAFLVDLPYGPGWQCERGYAVSESQLCEMIQVPVNAHLNRRGDAWECNRPYKMRDNKCELSNK